MDSKGAVEERKKTDDSLATERAQADVAQRERIRLEQATDAAVGEDRDTTDAILRSARARTDGHDAAQRAADDELATERSAADEALRTERAARTRLLARFFALERHQTDQHLLTERARSDAAVANREEILTMVSHDLRDLLSTVIMSASAISETAGGDHAERIHRAAGRMARLIGDLVDIANIDAGRLSVTPAAHDVAETIADAVETWSPAAVAKGIRIEARCEEPLVGHFDRDRVLQVLGNLITNAAKFSARGTSITVSAELAGGRIRVSVRDQGQGIPRDQLEVVFDRFWQANEAGRRGLGLGLYISRCIVEAHGGAIWATSEEGVGSTFFFTLPLC